MLDETYGKSFINVQTRESGLTIVVNLVKFSWLELSCFIQACLTPIVCAISVYIPFANEVMMLLYIGIMILLPLSFVYSAINPISSEHCAKMIAQNVINKNNPVGCDRLRIVNFSYINFEGIKKEGSVVVLDVLAERVQIIFNKLLNYKFPLNKASLLENYQGNDNASMEDNNTSAFNGRLTTGKDSWSMHAYGAAIDLNPLQNPLVSYLENETLSVNPKASMEKFINRLNYRPNKILRLGMAEEVIDIFAENGFISWGGYWDSPIDYQHFEISNREFAQKLINLSFKEGRHVFEKYIKSYNKCLSNANLPHEAARASCVSQINPSRDR